MKTNDFKTKDEAELQKAISASREELRVARFAAAGAAPRDLKAMRAAKKGIARMLTELSVRRSA
ncbi:50S ribosomal protein L29 [Candidatus Kaiserbacteria bacterium]|nr:50S ribosomal protein L29 [Candidatus Kaiserbacteria bacterium]